MTKLKVPRKRRHNKEFSIHRGIAQYLRWVLTEDTYFTSVEVSNRQGGMEGYIKQGMDKARGVKKGFPDILLIYKGQAYTLEVKPHGEKVKDYQAEEHSKIRRAGAVVLVVHDIEEVRKFLVTYNIPRREIDYV